MKFLTSFLMTLSFAAAALAQAPSTQMPQTHGPKIPRVVALRPQPVFERIEHPAPAAGRKIVTFEVPSVLRAAFDGDQLQVSVVFTITKETDDCNETKLYGRVIENEVPGAPTALSYYALEIKPGRISKTLKECNEITRAPRKIEIGTELRALRAFRDTQVFDVPEDVDVAVTVYSPLSTSNAVRAE